MDAHLEEVSLRFHKRLLRYHKAGLAFDLAEGAFLPSLYHALCVGIETFAVMYHKYQLRKLKGGR